MLCNDSQISSATAGEYEARPLCGDSKLCDRSIPGSVPRCTILHQIPLSAFHDRPADTPTGPSVPTAPHAILPPFCIKRSRYPLTSTTASVAGIESTCGPASSSDGQSASKQQWRPTTPNVCAEAITPDSMSATASGASGKSFDMRSTINGSSNTMSCIEFGSTSASTEPSVATCSLIACVATRNAR